MGRRSVSGGVRAKGSDRIEFTFFVEGVRYRPTVKRIPSEANLRRARLQLVGIKKRIEADTFNFREEFPDYRYQDELPQTRRSRKCTDMFKDFLGHAAWRVQMNDLAFATLESYRKIINNLWSPAIGEYDVEAVKYSDLVKVCGKRKNIKKKTYNNIVSAVRCAFEYEFRDHREKNNPAEALKCLRIRKKDKPVPDPFTIQEAESVIAAIHHDWGEAQGSYDEFRFFTGLRPSEEIALEIADCDLVKGTILVNKARVMRRDKDRTKTGEDRIVELCPRALEVLKRQLALRDRMKLAGRIHHENVFFRDDGSQIRNLNDPYDNWRASVERLKIRYREPKNARQSCVSWYLMIGRNVLWVSKNLGHSVQTMLSSYAAWTEGAMESDIAAIRRAMESRPPSLSLSASCGLSPVCGRKTKARTQYVMAGLEAPARPTCPVLE